MKHKLAIFGSGEGTTLEYLWEQQQSGALALEIVVAVSNQDCSFITKAQERNIPTLVSKDWDVITNFVTFTRAEAALLTGFMRVVPDSFLDWVPCINIHPAYLPEFPGKDPQRQALQAGATSTGVTIHTVTSELDAGPILLQQRVPILKSDTEETLSRRLKFLSYRMLSTLFEDMYGWTNQ